MMVTNEYSRREFLIATSGAVAGLATFTQHASAAETLPIIDCHAHIYSEDDKTYPLIDKPYRPPAGKGTISHLRQELKSAGVHSAAAIHTFTYYGWDNRFTADACRDNGDIITGVCLLDPDDPHSRQDLERYVGKCHVRGLRFITNRKTGRLDDTGNNALLATCERLGITACALVNRTERTQLEALAARYPKLPIVIDHALNLVAGKDYDSILRDLLEMSKVPTFYAKLSHVVTGSAEEYPFRDMHASCRKIIEAYGPERCIWGSDFPCELWCPKATYQQHLRVFAHELGLNEAMKRQILCDTPRRLGFGV